MQSDRRLSDLYHRGVDPAFDELVDRYRASLTAFAGAIVGAARAEDVVQESLIKAHRAMASAAQATILASQGESSRGSRGSPSRS